MSGNVAENCFAIRMPFNLGQKLLNVLVFEVIKYIFLHL